MYSIVFILLTFISFVWSHGRLIDPPSRSSAWRYGYPTPINYNDNELFCGGFSVQYSPENHGRCGICGDPYNGERQNEFPNGKYAKNLVITRNYKPNSIIISKVQITANHKGYFVFRLCPATSKTQEVTQECLDKYTLEVVNGDGFRYYLPSNQPETYSIALKIPNITCTRCVLQWTYTAGNNWGKCDNGTYAVGCGPQETFRGCGDVSISLSNNNSSKKTSSDWENFIPNKKSTKTVKNSLSTQLPYSYRTRNWNTDPPFRRKIYSYIPLTTKKKLVTEDLMPEPTTPRMYSKRNYRSSCYPSELYNTIIGMESWCNLNCGRGFCPKSHCRCIK